MYSHVYGYGPDWLARIVANHGLDFTNKFGSSFLIRTIRVKLWGIIKVVVVNCWYFWENLMFVSDSFFFLPLSLVIFLFVRQSCKGIKNRRKKTRTPLDSNYILRGVWLFCGMECFLKPVEIVTLPQTRCLKNIMESALTNYEILSCISVFSEYIQLRLQLTGVKHTAKFRTQRARAFPITSREKKVHLSQPRW